jgi:Ni,Fe-hydrogenase I large subunit
MAVAHYLEALDWQREFIKFHAIIGGKNPHLQSFLVGGMATPVDPDSQAALNVGTIAHLKQLTKSARDFVSRVYIPDLMAIAPFYTEWAGYGKGSANYLSYGDYPEDDGAHPQTFIPSGVIRAADLGHIEDFDAAKITENVKHAWYEYTGGDERGLHPYSGETTPKFTGPKPPFEHLNTDEKYSWLKSPRYDGQPMEVGPLARFLVAYGRGHARVKELVDGTLAKLGVPAPALFSTLGRVAARGLETLLLTEKIDDWIDQLADNMGRRELAIADTSKWDPKSWPKDCAGAGFHEAPRGALGHWVHIVNGKIAHYQCVVPSTWNAGPRDGKGVRGPYEAALLGTPVLDGEQPIELLRTIHSFDPCMACGVHVAGAKSWARAL